MNTLKNMIFKIGLIVIPVAIFIGVFLSLKGIPHSELIIIGGLAIWISLLLISLAEIIPSNQFTTTKKVIWLIAFLFNGYVAALLYYFLFREKVMNDE